MRLNIPTSRMPVEKASGSQSSLAGGRLRKARTIPTPAAPRSPSGVLTPSATR